MRVRVDTPERYRVGLHVGHDYIVRYRARKRIEQSRTVDGLGPRLGVGQIDRSALTWRARCLTACRPNQFIKSTNPAS